MVRRPVHVVSVVGIWALRAATRVDAALAADKPAANKSATSGLPQFTPNGSWPGVGTATQLVGGGMLVAFLLASGAAALFLGLFAWAARSQNHHDRSRYGWAFLVAGLAAAGLGGLNTLMEWWWQTGQTISAGTP